jgi:predicted nucleic acid-binding protein
MPYLLDADWAIEALANRPRAVTALRRVVGQGLAISLITVAELYEVAFNSPNPDAYVDHLRRFLAPLRVLALDLETVERFAQIRSGLRRRGQIIPDFDILVGATALRHDLTLLTFNVRHLARIEGLRIYRPPAL